MHFRYGFCLSAQETENNFSLSGGGRSEVKKVFRQVVGCFEKL